VHVHAPRNKALFQWLSIKLLWSLHTLRNYDQSSLTKRDNTPSVSLGRGGYLGSFEFVSLDGTSLLPCTFWIVIMSKRGFVSLSLLGVSSKSLDKYQQSGERKSTFGEYLGQVICGCFNPHMHKLFNEFCPFEICPTDSSGQNPWRIGKEGGESERTESRDLCLFYFLGIDAEGFSRITPLSSERLIILLKY
jgi:hypothetical protein